MTSYPNLQRKEKRDLMKIGLEALYYKGSRGQVRSNSRVGAEEESVSLVRHSARRLFPA